MTIGEKIQIFRKQLGMSQDDLGQKLLVSRQTISLWEKNQTTPTIDNLIRLREVFGVSVDEILGFENTRQSVEETPIDKYRVDFSEEQIKDIARFMRRKTYSRPFISVLLYIILLVVLIGLSAPTTTTGFAFVMLLGVSIAHIKNIRTYEKHLRTNLFGRLFESTYEYIFFEDYMKIIVYRKDEQVRVQKCRRSDIESIQQTDKFIILQIGGQLFFIKKDDLKENFPFYSFINKNVLKSAKPLFTSKWSILSAAMFVLSILSIYGAMILVSVVSFSNHLSTENMWLFFLFTPIPVLSIVLGFVMKFKGKDKYKKNIVVGVIMTVLLCVFGSFSFVFADMYEHSAEPIARVEQTVGIDIPEHSQINTMDLTKGQQNYARGYICSYSEVYFDNYAVENFEKQLITDDRWLSPIPSDLIGISSSLTDYNGTDYVLIYNTDTKEYNTLPDSKGLFHFVSVQYNIGENQMEIVEYDIDYVK